MLVQEERWLWSKHAIRVLALPRWPQTTHLSAWLPCLQSWVTENLTAPRKWNARGTPDKMWTTDRIMRTPVRPEPDQIFQNTDSQPASSGRAALHSFPVGLEPSQAVSGSGLGLISGPATLSSFSIPSNFAVDMDT